VTLLDLGQVVVETVEVKCVLTVRNLICAVFDIPGLQFVISTYNIGFHVTVKNVFLSAHFSSPVLFTSATHFNQIDLNTIEVSGEDKYIISPPYYILSIFLLLHAS